ncbi:MAG TPA: UDP-N-acetylglucosamine 2-epimerase (non-hydrolyzing) [Anaerolineae bacterium]|nr:UDP-N-acetylglucosamine 2-epimerase (non-hydrolyzing) [Anaerolineae bacterium]HQH39827.1 UDP-N-acetylglucosamine 2-epimerase (non-hydrolyzing) [Anaerolineae bacterium]
MLKVLSIFGTRPEAIKMAPVVKELERHPDRIISRVCVTAQHREMLDQVLTLFQIVPDYDLNLMRPNQSLSALTARVFTELDAVLAQEQPDWVLVQGDTTTVMAASLVAFYHRVKVGHVEAGLRTYDKWQPFPEEINRRVAGVVADAHFAATETAKANLLREGVAPAAIYVTGNPVIDALKTVAEMPYDVAGGPLAGIPWNKRIILVTAHRRENFGQPLENICAALREIAAQYADEVQIVYPVHLNPHVQEPVYRLLGNVPNITLLPPLDYLPMVQLMKHCTLVLTDSGGLQEEAPGLGKPVLVLRETTERPEGVAAGTVRVVGTAPAEILLWSQRLLEDSAEYDTMAQAVNPYGDGRAAESIVGAVL